MICPFKQYVLAGQTMVGVYQCSACGTFTNDPPELGNYACKQQTADCVQKLTGLAATKATTPKHPGWGDLLAAKLDSIGITKERWTEGLVALGLTTYEEGCNCANRQQKLNELGEKVMAWWKQHE